MSRSSLRMKQYRPISADFTKVSALSAVFGLGGGSNNPENENPAAEPVSSTSSAESAGDNGNDKTGSCGGVMLINCKYFYSI